LTLERLDLGAAEAAFVDDAEPNVIGARALGLIGIEHRTPAETRTALAELIPTLSPEPETSTR
jgi:putative hydrolase of the HAD superfamily